MFTCPVGVFSSCISSQYSTDLESQTPILTLSQECPSVPERLTSEEICGGLVKSTCCVIGFSLHSMCKVYVLIEWLCVIRCDVYVYWPAVYVACTCIREH